VIARSPQGGAESAERVVAWLKRTGTRATRDGMARYAIPSDRAFGVPVGVMQKEAKRLGRDHALAAALWDAGWYEARMMAVFLDEPARVTAAQMDRWCRDFDSWAICDTACLHLFDRVPHAHAKVGPWTKRRGEFQKRGGYALLAALALHDKAAPDEPFLDGLRLIERDAGDARNFVTKGINWALRAIGRRPSPALRRAAIATAERLAGSGEPAPRWVGRDALRQMRR
jgi:3-methyladenine DNA glycosylase AlkD